MEVIQMRILSNPEIKKYNISIIALFLIIILLSIFINTLNLNIIKADVIQNNQAIVGNIVSKYPELEKDIVSVITQAKNKENIDLGAKVLQKYNYDSSTNLSQEPIVQNNIYKMLKINILFITFVFICLITISFYFFIKIYRDIKDMTDYVYHSSEGREYEMKNKNQEGQIGLLKTELMKMTTVLKEKVALLHSEKIFLNDTISDISHQLKTPMTSLMLLTDLMYNDLDKEKKIEFLDRTNAQLSRMDWLIKSMLKLSKLEAKVIDFKTDKVNINELIRRSISPLSVPMELKNISLNINGNKEASYIGDIEWSSEALGNIIKNCIEHTKEGGTLDITYEENPIYSEIIIKDNGEGIDKDDIQNIFKRFYKGKNSKSDSVGIGLAMAKSIIESQNGDIYVKSKKNRGSEFHITFHKRYN
ncbi:HAMP domain-containing sensor histidine kinase [Clostridium sp. 1001270J_160509_D11]|uniref:sensor histidine kinase n=1 Tax=Clostridium sp. 1001270J_160509_D11 TaxID=2787103 RepID=UPI001FAC8091|nr:HAMP domain-containing sensor histidine kinase [Clostridium sp. 1001270J_160509_D11]